MLNRKVGLHSDLVIELADGSMATQLGIADRVGTKPGLWTLDWTMDWTMD